MKKRKTRKEAQVESQIEFGLDAIDENLTVEVNLKKMLLVYRTIQELRRFFHNPDHFPTLDDVHVYLGNSSKGMYAVLNRIYCKEFVAMLPSAIAELAESDQFRNLDLPYYVELSDLR